jgi:tRNA nucleotidyltransferase (CCA-adding enzyme)
MTVREIMSRGPQLLEPTATVAEAAQRMQRSGHEGYPIVEGDQVLGLLTRRAVDRAMAHGLGSRPVSSVMKAGDLVVHPEDSVQALQRQMILNDWGQVPVADGKSGAIIGIVTRTDLLRTIGKPGEAVTERNLADRLESALPAPRLHLLKAIAAEAEANDIALYVVGGFVRDLLLGEPSVDFDLVVEGDAIQLAYRLAERYGGHISSHRRFGTAKWQLDREAQKLRTAIAGPTERTRDLPAAVDFVSARSEFYLHPTALPTVERGSIKLDLHRRDFTINTLALRLDGRYYGRLLDHWGGGQDLKDGLIRVLHSLSFVDDPTRMLRAVRLEQRLGFKIESRTLELLQDAVGLLDRVSGDRIRSELSLVLQESSMIATMGRLADLGLLRAVHPELSWDPWLQSHWQRAQRFEPPERWNLQQDLERDILYFGLWMFRKQPEIIEDICRRLRMPGGERDVILEAARLRRLLAGIRPDRSPSLLTELMDGIPEASLVVAWLGIVDDGHGQQAIDQYLREWRWLQPKTDGHTLQQLGLPAGPIYKRILSRLRTAWLNGEVESEDEERALLEDLVAQEEANG